MPSVTSVSAAVEQKEGASVGVASDTYQQTVVGPDGKVTLVTVVGRSPLEPLKTPYGGLQGFFKLNGITPSDSES